MQSRYYIVNLTTGEKFGPYQTLTQAENKACRYSVDNEPASVIDDTNKVYCGYKHGRRIEAKQEGGETR